MSLLLGVLFWLLKIILFIILIILFIILILSLIVFFVPINYDVKTYAENLLINPKNIKVSINISWLFKILRAKIKYFNNKFNLEILVFNINIKKKRKKKKKKKEKKEKNIRKKEKNIEDNTKSEKFIKEKLPADYKYQDVIKENNNKIFEKVERKDFDDKNINEQINKGVDLNSNNDNDTTDEKSIFFEKANGIKDQILYYYNYPDRDIILKSSFKLLKNLFKSIRPNNFELDFEIGLEDMALTGQIAGLTAVFSSIFLNKIFLRANFEKKIIKANIWIKGKIVIWNLFFPLVKFLLSKPIFKIIKAFIFKKNKSN